MLFLGPKAGGRRGCWRVARRNGIPKPRREADRAAVAWRELAVCQESTASGGATGGIMGPGPAHRPALHLGPGLHTGLHTHALTTLARWTGTLQRYTKLTRLVIPHTQHTHIPTAMQLISRGAHASVGPSSSGITLNQSHHPTIPSKRPAPTSTSFPRQYLPHSASHAARPPITRAPAAAPAAPQQAPPPPPAAAAAAALSRPACGTWSPPAGCSRTRAPAG